MNSTSTMEILSDRQVKLIPFEKGDAELDYFFTLISQYKYNTVHSADKITEIVDRYCKFFWLGMNDGVKRGVIFLMYLPEINEWSLDAYADPYSFRGKDFSIISNKLVIDWFFSNNIAETLTTRHDVRNVTATKICERAGFKDGGRVITELGEFIMMSISKDIWGLRKHYGN